MALVCEAPSLKVVSFSALQRAENSSISPKAARVLEALAGFSALQRAENSSMEELPSERTAKQQVSVLFSEPKIPQ